MWVFGYGSLIWKVDFPYERKLVGYIEGYSRRFWQGSEDHRGIPGKPGRVVTLIPSEPTDRVYGVAYEIPEEQEEEVTAHLDFREKGGYTKHSVVFHPEEKKYDSFSLDIYIGTDDNPLFLGNASMTEIAHQIYHAEGPSGPNTEYLFQLASAIKKLGVEDTHIEELEEAVKKLVH